MDAKKNFTVTNIKAHLKNGKEGEEHLHELLAGFRCPPNPDVERFLHNQAIDSRGELRCDFAKRNLSVTYLVTSKADDELVSYFTLAIKSLSVNARAFSNTMRRKIERVSEVNEQTGEYILAVYLIAQLDKNFAGGMNERITGEGLLELALDKIRDAQFRLGGTVVFLEADNVEKLIAFYETNGFRQFAVRTSRGTQEAHKLVQLLRVM